MLIKHILKKYPNREVIAIVWHLYHNWWSYVSHYWIEKIIECDYHCMNEDYKNKEWFKPLKSYYDINKRYEVADFRVCKDLEEAKELYKYYREQQEEEREFFVWLNLAKIKELPPIDNKMF